MKKFCGIFVKCEMQIHQGSFYNKLRNKWAKFRFSFFSFFLLRDRRGKQRDIETERRHGCECDLVLVMDKPAIHFSSSFLSSMKQYSIKINK